MSIRHSHRLRRTAKKEENKSMRLSSLPRYGGIFARKKNQKSLFILRRVISRIGTFQNPHSKIKNHSDPLTIL